MTTIKYHNNIKKLDINECEDGLNGGCGQVCNNLVGSFDCTCNPGYELDVGGFDCIG